MEMRQAQVVVPDVAIQWLARFADSNVELAALSNVNRHWRQQVAFVIFSDEQDTPLSSLLLPTMARRMRHSQQQQQQHDVSGTFCLAWFPPMGIQVLSVQMGETMSSEEDTDHQNGSDAFAPSGCPSYEGSDSEKKQPPFRTLAAAVTRVKRGTKVSEASRLQTCSHEWRGYRVPLDVLRPFGYATDFINVRVLWLERRMQTFASLSPHT